MTRLKDPRGNCMERRARRWWLLRRYGNGIEAPCLLRIHPACERKVSDATMNVDRLLPGSGEGRYIHPNIIPACAPCNFRRKDKRLRAVMSRRRVETLMRRLEGAVAQCGCRSCKTSGPRVLGEIREQEGLA